MLKGKELQRRRLAGRLPLVLMVLCVLCLWSWAASLPLLLVKFWTFDNRLSRVGLPYFHLRGKSRGLVIAVYIVKEIDLNCTKQTTAIRELHSYFHERLFVVTDSDVTRQNNTKEDCCASLLPPEQIITPADQTVTQKGLFSHAGHAQERAMMWLIDHPELHDYAWLFEDDLFWPNFTEFRRLLQYYANDTTDLLHQNCGMENNPSNKTTGWWYGEVLPPKVRKEAKIDAPRYNGVFNIYRISNGVEANLQRWRETNGGEWTFFEPLIAARIVQDPNLTTKCWREHELDFKFHFRLRPCFEKDEVYQNFSGKGLFHPVKGDFLPCTA